MNDEQTVFDLSAARARKKQRSKDRAKEEAESFPDPFPLESTLQVLKLARSNGYSFAQTLFATASVKYWGLGGNREGKIVVKLRWPLVIANSMRLGWGLRGFEKWRRLQRFPDWMDKPLRVFLLDDLVMCVEKRSRGIKDFVPRMRDARGSPVRPSNAE